MTDIALQPTCSTCDGTGWEEIQGKGVRPCQCKTEKKLQTCLAQARIPARYANATFDSFQLLCPSLNRALQTTKRFLDETEPDVGLLYIGSCGVGKTHLAVAVLRELIRKGHTGLFYDFRDLLKEIQDSFNPNTHASELAILAPVLQTNILVLDELGATKPTAWVQETMTYIINQRYNEKRVTIFTSNYLDDQPETLTERVGVRLRSRLNEMCKLVSIEAIDYRSLIHEQRANSHLHLT